MIATNISFKFTCDKCGAEYEIESAKAHEIISCPNCKTRYKIIMPLMNISNNYNYQHNYNNYQVYQQKQDYHDKDNDSMPISVISFLALNSISLLCGIFNAIFTNTVNLVFIIVLIVTMGILFSIKYRCSWARYVYLTLGWIGVALGAVMCFTIPSILEYMFPSPIVLISYVSSFIGLFCLADSSAKQWCNK